MVPRWTEIEPYLFIYDDDLDDVILQHILLYITLQVEYNTSIMEGLGLFFGSIFALHDFMVRGCLRELKRMDPT